MCLCMNKAIAWLGCRLFVDMVSQLSLEYNCHTLIPGLNRMADSNRVQGARLYTRTLYLFLFFLKAKLVPVGIQTISIIKKIIYIYKRTTTGVVSIKIYTHILSPIYIYKTVLLHLQIRARNLHVVNPY